MFYEIEATRRRPRRIFGSAGIVLTSIAVFGVLSMLLAVANPWGADLEGDPRRHQLSFLSPKLADGTQRAFPSAQGYGAGAKGGRGGEVIFVDTLAEHGKGSLRACVEAAGPRNCVFRLSGTIILEDAPLVVRDPYLTIAGETAPGDGIAIRNGPRQVRPSIEIRTHDVVMRYLRLRPGPHTVEACCSGALGLYGADATDIIIDHVSASWGSDETIDSKDATNVTVQWSIIAEPLISGGPGKDGRARNMYFTKGGNFSIHHNLFAFGRFRNPQFQSSLPSSVEDVVNNVFYSPDWDYVVSFSDKLAPVHANVIGNYKLAGQKRFDDHLVHLFEEGERGFSIYLEDNYDETYRPTSDIAQDAVLAEPLRRFAVARPFPAPDVKIDSAETAYALVLKKAGATRPRRDAADRRIVASVHGRSGKMVKSDPARVGGWPSLTSEAPPSDADGDGLPDWWEMNEGLDPSNAEDGAADSDGDGWTNFEEYLHVLAGDDVRADRAVRLASQRR